MHGNVAEWCNDFYGEKAYAVGAAAATDPRGPSSGKERVLRGGSWRSGAESCRSAARNSEEPGLTDVCFGYEAYGFRCVRKAPAPGKRHGNRSTSSAHPLHAGFVTGSPPKGCFLHFRGGLLRKQR
jgi:hypothetical protein